MATKGYTTDELIESLKRTRIKTIVVEGGDDIEVLRDLESKLVEYCGFVDFCHAGDKSSVLRIWERKDTFPNEMIGFLVDSDLWLFNTEREKYPKVVFTHGYSIENICIQSQSVVAMANAREPIKRHWETAIIGLAEWFAAEAAYHLDGQNPVLDIGIHQILDVNAGFELTQLAKARIAEAPAAFFASTKNTVALEPLRFIRGKQLFLALSEVLCKHDGDRTSVKVLKRIGSRTSNAAIDALVAELATSFI
jgi:hypothetical protein